MLQSRRSLRCGKFSPVADARAAPVLRDFERIRLPVTCLDFGLDPSLFKLRTTTEWRRIRHYYLFKRTFAGAVQYATLAATDLLSRSLGVLAKRLWHSETNEQEKYINRAAAHPPRT